MVAAAVVMIVVNLACVGFAVVVGQSILTAIHWLHLALNTKFPGHIWHADPMLSVQVKNCCSLSGFVYCPLSLKKQNDCGGPITRVNVWVIWNT